MFYDNILQLKTLFILIWNFQELNVPENFLVSENFLWISYLSVAKEPLSACCKTFQELNVPENYLVPENFLWTSQDQSVCKGTVQGEGLLVFKIAFCNQGTPIITSIVQSLLNPSKYFHNCLSLPGKNKSLPLEWSAWKLLQQDVLSRLSRKF